MAIRGQVSRRLEALCRELPPDLSMAGLVAFGLYLPAQDALLKNRVRWLASHLNRDSRTARRRIDTAVESLARDITVVATVSVAASVPYELLGGLLLDAGPRLVARARGVLGHSTVEHAYACAIGEQRLASVSSVVVPDGVAGVRQPVGVDAGSRHAGHRHRANSALAMSNPNADAISDTASARGIGPVGKAAYVVGGPVRWQSLSDTRRSQPPVITVHRGECRHTAWPRDVVVGSLSLDSHHQDQRRTGRPAGAPRPAGVVEDAASPDVLDHRQCEQRETKAEEVARDVRYLTVVYDELEKAADRDLFHQFVSTAWYLAGDGQISPRCGGDRWTVRIKPPAEDLLAKLEQVAHELAARASRRWQISRAG